MATSFMGGFEFGPYDRTERTGGVPPPNPNRKHEIDSYYDNLDEVHDSPPRDDDVRSIAQQVVGETGGHQDDDVFHYSAGTDLDPFSDSFNVKEWTKEFARAISDGPHRTSGVAYRNMSVHGFGSDYDYQTTVGNVIPHLVGKILDKLGHRKRKVQILEGIDGVLESGEMLMVLGPPGSGCTTLLKTIAGDTHGLYLAPETELNYRGITREEMKTQFRGEAIYTAEVDVHFPKLLVKDTLDFAALARAPRVPPGGLSQKKYAEYMANVVMAVFSISHTAKTLVGNDYIRGVSGGERKRVTIAEATLSGAPLQCWDNSTRGLDSANAIEFCKTLRLQTQYFGTAAVVAIYQAPQSAYDLFDKVCVLYEGQQIYFGRIGDARQFFIDMGFDCPEQQTTPDFLTSLTSPTERHARPGFESTVPHTPQEFAARWKQSAAYRALMEEIDTFEERHPLNGAEYDKFQASRLAQKSKHSRAKSPYTLSYKSQVKLCMGRAVKRLYADPSMSVAQIVGNTVMSLIISSLFYNLQMNTASFTGRPMLLFFAILMNAFSAVIEIITLYAQRPIIEKHKRYAFYHPSADALASVIVDFPQKLANALVFNTVIYFMAHLRREPGPYFLYQFVSILLTLTMSMLFRSVGAFSRTREQAMAPAALLMLSLVMYTGQTIPVPYMHGWARWINYINPIGYGFETLMISEFHGRNFTCSTWVPAGPFYANATGTQHVCSAVGGIPGENHVMGQRYISLSYQYEHAHKWRNVGIIIGFLVFFLCVYLWLTETVSAAKSKGEVLIYPRKRIPRETRFASDEEAQMAATRDKLSREESSRHVTLKIQKQTAVFSWKDLVFDIKVKGEPRRLLDHVDGWVKPGTLTALMGVSGAGKTVLLDTLAERTSIGVVSGDVLVDGRPRDKSFQRKTGYVQQQDLHLETSTVREALRFSAVLRQPASVSREEKYAYVEEILALLEMDGYADAVVGVPGEGLNVEQRKRLTIGVELVAKPALLLFLDEPTSGLDSQTSWNILQLLKRLKDHNQAILCTIHQPSAMLFEQFDQLLFLAKGGRPLYFGPVGSQSATLIDYFERNGAVPYPKGGNPAEWMFTAVGSTPGSHTDIDWHATWLNSPERVKVRQELDALKAAGLNKPAASAQDTLYAASFGTQFREVFIRVNQQYWRTPSYIWSKIGLTSFTGLFIGFSFFRADNSQQGLQSQVFAVFMMFTTFGQLIQQIMPTFVIQRSLYEVRERPSKTYSWYVFILCNILVEIPWAMFVGTTMWAEWYWPPGFYRNTLATNSFSERVGLMWLFVQAFMIFTSTFAHMVVVGIELAETAAQIGMMLFSQSLIFCGVLVPRNRLPGFWKWMPRVSPLAYLVEGFLTTAVANSEVICAAHEYVTITPPAGLTCAGWMGPYMKMAGGYVSNPDATSDCKFCAVSSTNTFLATMGVNFKYRWRDFGIMWIYIVFNICAAIFIYWLARVPKRSRFEQSGPQPTSPATPDSQDTKREVTDHSEKK